MKTKITHTHPAAHDESLDLLAAVGRHVRRPIQAQIASAGEVARELRDGVTYDADFGAGAPKPATVAALLETAARASTEHAALAKQLAALDERRVTAWNAVLAAIHALGVRLDARATLDATVTQRWPALAAFAHARAPSAKRAATAARSKRKERKQKEAAKAAAPATSTTAATSPATTTTVTTTTPVTTTSA